MIPRLNLVSSTVPRQQRWPETPQREIRRLFEPRSPLRKLTVMVDDKLLTPPEGEWNQTVVLLSLLAHEMIDVYRFSDDGPPPDAKRRRGRGDAEVAIGWASVGLPSDKLPYATRPVTVADEKRSFHTGIYGNFADIASVDGSATSYAELGHQEAQARRERDYVAAQVAEAAEADLFITDRVFLFESSYVRRIGTTCCSVSDALALVGLYLRTQGEFLVMGPPTKYAMNRGYYYLVGARELLPETWRWFSACTQHDRSEGADGLTNLASSLIQRIERCLWARDDVHRTSNRNQHNDTGDLTLEALDRLLLFLMGAVDVSGRVAHRILGLTGSERDASWRRDRWMKKVLVVCPALAALFEPGSAHSHALTILAGLRNSVHGAALSNVRVRMSSTPERNLLSLPRDETASILAAMDALGGRATWGVEHESGDLTLSDCPTLIEQLIPHIVDLLNAVLKATPVETLGGVALVAEDCVPPPGQTGYMDPFSQDVRLSIRWQLGL